MRNPFEINLATTYHASVSVAFEHRLLRWFRNSPLHVLGEFRLLDPASFLQGSLLLFEKVLPAVVARRRTRLVERPPLVVFLTAPFAYGHGYLLAK